MARRQNSTTQGGTKDRLTSIGASEPRAAALWLSKTGLWPGLAAPMMMVVLRSTPLMLSASSLYRSVVWRASTGTVDWCLKPGSFWV